MTSKKASKPNMPEVFENIGTTAQPEYMTPKQASEYTGKDKAVIKRAMFNPRYAAIFADQTDTLEFPGTDYAPVQRVTKSALDAWLEASAKVGSGSRAPRGTGRRYVISVADDKIVDVTAALAPFGIEPVKAFKSKNADAKPRKRGSSNGTSEAPATTNDATFEHELVEA